MIKRRCNGMLRVFLFGFFLFILSSCTTTPTYELSKNYARDKYKRVALLVVRVGNLSRVGGPVPVALDTDYSVRTPQVGSALLQYPAKVDVYIEDEARLRESLPEYPDYPLHGAIEKIKHFKNITPQIYKAVSSLLTEKGYHVVNAKEVAASWRKKISDMKVGEIVDALKKDADAVLVMHYTDVGYYFAFAGGYTRIFEGFVQLNYAVAMFDVNTKERLMHFRSDNPFLDAVPRVIMEDPGVNGSELTKKIKTVGSRDLYYYNVDLSAAEDEVIALVMGYLRRGNNVKKGDSERWKWTGLDEVIP